MLNYVKTSQINIIYFIIKIEKKHVNFGIKIEIIPNNIKNGIYSKTRRLTIIESKLNELKLIKITGLVKINAEIVVEKDSFMFNKFGI